MDAIQPVADACERTDGIPVKAGSLRAIAPFLFLHRLLQYARTGVEVFEHDQDVLAQAQRVLEEIRAVAASIDRIDGVQDRPIRPRPVPVRRVT